MKRVVLSFFLFVPFMIATSCVYGGIPEDLVTAREDVAKDFGEISKWISGELSEGMAFNAGSGNVLPADIIEFPGFGFGISAGASLWPVNAGEFRALNLRTIDTSSANKIDMPDTIGMINIVGHVKTALPFGLDIGARVGGFNFDDDTGNASVELENALWGVELRKRILGGSWTNILLPDLSVSVSFDNAVGSIERKESYSDRRTETYEGSSYTQEIQSETLWKTEWNTQNIGIKTIVSKTFLFITPYFGLGVNKHMGSTETKIVTTGTISLEIPYFPSQSASLSIENKSEVDADDTTMRLLTGVELKIFLLRLGISAEFAGDYKAYHTALRFQFR